MYSLLHSRPFSNILAVDRNPIHPTQRTETPGGAHIRCSSVDLIALSCWSYNFFHFFCSLLPSHFAGQRQGWSLFSRWHHFLGHRVCRGQPARRLHKDIEICPVDFGYRFVIDEFLEEEKKLKWWRMADNGWQRRACNGASRNKCSISKRKRLDFLCSPMYGQRTVLDYVNIPLNC